MRILPCLPHYLFCFLEIELGNLFGKGGFFTVSEVKSIQLQDSDDEEEEELIEVVNPEDDDHILGVVQNRRFMAKHCLRKGKDCRYAFKTMRDLCRTDPSMFVNTAVDMAIEAKFLSSVRHPNIIKMRAMSAGDMIQSNAFIILDRLYDTLTDRLNQWKKKDQNGFHRLFDFHKKKENHFFAQRLTVAYDVSILRVLRGMGILLFVSF